MEVGINVALVSALVIPPALTYREIMHSSAPRDSLVSADAISV